jgi:hypothetical protein
MVKFDFRLPVMLGLSFRISSLESLLADYRHFIMINLSLDKPNFLEKLMFPYVMSVTTSEERIRNKAHKNETIIVLLLNFLA